MSLSNDRIDYRKSTFDDRAADPDPIAQFRRWLDEADAAGVPEPNAMTLATATSDGAPSARIVLLRGVDQRGFVFFTDYRSRKGRELGANPRAALVFFWHPVERQVRITGTVARVAVAESASYFETRPRGSQLGAWGSEQSAVIPSREAIDQAVAAAERRFADRLVPCPPHWGGFRLDPEQIEFWQGRPSRLHDRLRYSLGAEGWTIDRLSP
jgi:pyridoxamine 5'-phosphate oxidase